MITNIERPCDLAMLAVIFLFSCIHILSATGSECTIYVSSSGGINNASCWTGGYQTPCATLDLALQGTATDAIQDNCSSGIVISLSPGTYTLDTSPGLDQQLMRSNVIMRNDNSEYEEVSIMCLNVSSSSYQWLRYAELQSITLYNCNINSYYAWNDNVYDGDFCPLSLFVTPTNLNLKCYDFYLPYHSYWSRCECEHLNFTAKVTDCFNRTFTILNKVQVSAYDHYSKRNYEDIIRPENAYYELPFCFDHISAGPFNISLFVNIIELKNASTNVTQNVSVDCATSYKTYSGRCRPIYVPKYDFCNQEYCPFPYDCPFVYNCPFVYDESVCKISLSHYCAKCPSHASGVPITAPHMCINCKNWPDSLFLFFVLEILPITIMVLLMIAFNIQLTNGSINGFVFYSQIVVFIMHESLIKYHSDFVHVNTSYIFMYVIPYVFSLDYTFFLDDPLCITPNMSPLEAVSFWYVIGFYPLLLLLLIYVWIVLYDKGFRCVVCITRPFHRCMARFWSMTGIEPSLIHSVASIYILCFTQLVATSFKVLSAVKVDGSTFFLYDTKQKYFYRLHGIAGSFAVFIFLFLILLPTLYIQFYPFRVFHKLLDYLNLRKQLLISLGDVFTGPYKNGSNNTFDYRFFAGFYFLARIIILCPYTFAFVDRITITAACCSFALAVMLLIFRPFQRTIHSFIEVIILGVLICGSILMVNIIIQFETFNVSSQVFTIFTLIVFWPGLLTYIIYRFYKIINYCYRYYKQCKRTMPPGQEENQPLVGNDDDWIADRVENPQEYDEQHVRVKLDDYLPKNHPNQNNTTSPVTAATYGSTSTGNETRL